MPLPRYMPGAKKMRIMENLPPKSKVSSINDLDDYCISKIIAHALIMTSWPRDNDELIARDNIKTEKNLSLISKRWYFLTQMQVSQHGVCRIDLDRIIKGRALFNGPRVIQANNNKLTFTPRSPRVLTQRNTEIKLRPANCTPAIKRLRPADTINGPVEGASTLSTLLTYNIGLHRKIQPLLHKYKHLIIDGTIKCDEFYKLLVALQSAKVEKIQLNLKVERDGTLAKDFAVLPKQMYFLKSLTLIWIDTVDYMFGNILTWTIFMRAPMLNSLQIILNDLDGRSTTNEVEAEKINSIEKIAYTFLSKIQEYQHPNLNKIVFNRSSSQYELSSSASGPSKKTDDLDCIYSKLLKEIFAQERHLNQVETNDNSLIEELIRGSERVCTTNQLKHLKFSSIINSDLLLKILTSNNLGSQYLSVMIDNINQLDEIRLSMSNFRQNRQPNATCQICLYLKDQKFADCEDKIKNLIQLSKLTDLMVYVYAIQRVTIDCCHLMWSVGRALQASSNAPGIVTSSSSSSLTNEQTNQYNTTGRCIFKIFVQPSVKSVTTTANFLSGNIQSEITVPFGRYQNYKINSSREDMVRHREILKALKKDCYHQFVKSMRENVTP